MPANLPPDYHAAEKRYREARTPAEKIAALEEMLRIMPKHKGTDRLQGDLRARIAGLRKEAARKGSRKGFSWVVRREGAGQVALVGPANTGKSSLVARMTKARPEVAPYPYTTREPVPGMMPFENVAFQLVDLPAVSEEHTEPWLYDIVRGADLVWLVLDAGDSPGPMEEVRRSLEARRIGLTPATGAPEREDSAEWRSRRTLVVVTGLDRPGARENVAALDELLERAWPIAAVSCATGEGLEELRRRTFDAMGIMRVYTKEPGKPPDLEQPFALQRGATVAQLAEKIHKELLHGLKFARIWGSGAFPGQTVQRDHVLEEGDVVEIHA